jgi:multiple sugar transport system permease protein
MSNSPIDKVAEATPVRVARQIKGLSDRTIAWLFVGPTIFLLLAINIFPLIWTINLSFTNFRANRPNREVDYVGLRNYERILTDSDIWLSMQATAHFLFWTIALQVLIGFTLAYLINKKFKGNDLWTTIIVLPMMLSPAVVGNFWTFLYQPQIGLFNYIVTWFTGGDPSSFEMIGSVTLAPWSIIIVDTFCNVDLLGRSPIHTGLHLRGCRNRSRVEMAAVLDDYSPDGVAVPDAGCSLPRH